MTKRQDWDFDNGKRYFVTGGVDMFHVHDRSLDPNPSQGRHDCAYRVPRIGRTYRSWKAAANAARKLTEASA
jgi:hypothetical protein